MSASNTGDAGPGAAAIAGRGILGWLRAIYDKLVSPVATLLASILDQLVALVAKPASDVDRAIFGQMLVAARVNQVAVEWDKSVAANRVTTVVTGTGAVTSDTAAATTTPDAGPSAITANVVGLVLPALVASPFAGGFGNALQFDGVDRGAASQAIDLGTGQAFALSGRATWTFDAHVQLTAARVGDVIIARGDPATPAAFDWQISLTAISAQLFFQFQYRNAAGTLVIINSTAPVAAGVPYIIRASLTGGVMTFTVNGIGLAGGAPFATPLTLPCSVAANLLLSSPHPLAGIVDELRFSNVVRVDAGAAPYVSDGNTLALYHLDVLNVGAASTTGLVSVSTGAGVAASSARVTSIKLTKYRPGSEVFAIFTAIFTTPTLSTQRQQGGIFSTTSGFFLDYNGLTFGVTIRKNGIDDFRPRGAFVGDPLDGSVGSAFTSDGVPVALNLTRINIFRIRFGWLGSAPIFFEVLSPDDRWIVMHLEARPNASATPTIVQPNLPLQFEVSKAANDATVITLKSGSGAAGIVTDPYGLEPADLDGREPIDANAAIAGLATPVTTTIITVNTGRRIAVKSLDVSCTNLVTTGGEIQLTDGVGGTIKHRVQLAPATATTKQETISSQTFPQAKYFSTAVVLTVPALGVGGAASGNVVGYEESAP